MRARLVCSLLLVTACTPTTSSRALGIGPRAPALTRPTAASPGYADARAPRVVGTRFVDSAPPVGWRQCAGFVNTAGDDVSADFLDECLNTDRLRVRVFTADNELEEDVFVTGMAPLERWEDAYLQGTSTLVKQTHWGGLDGGAPSIFLTHTDGRDACDQAVAPSGTTLGSGHAERAVIAVDATGDDEYRISCGKQALPGRKIAVFR